MIFLSDFLHYWTKICLMGHLKFCTEVWLLLKNRYKNISPYLTSCTIRFRESAKRLESLVSILISCASSVSCNILQFSDVGGGWHRKNAISGKVAISFSATATFASNINSSISLWESLRIYGKKPFGVFVSASHVNPILTWSIRIDPVENRFSRSLMAILFRFKMAVRISDSVKPHEIGGKWPGSISPFGLSKKLNKFRSMIFLSWQN